jgi:hypothetical protein
MDKSSQYRDGNLARFRGSTQSPVESATWETWSYSPHMSIPPHEKESVF